MAGCCLNFSFACYLHCNCRPNSVYCNRITNAVANSGKLREGLFRAAYNSKKQAIMSGIGAHNYTLFIL